MEAAVRRAGVYCCVLWGLICPQAYAVEGGLDRGDPAPELTLPVLANALKVAGSSTPVAGSSPSKDSAYSLFTLSSYRGKVIYLDFWDSACVPCRDSLPLLSTLRDEFARSDVEIVAVNLDPDPNDALRFLSEYPVSYPVVSDPAASVSASTYNVTRLPTAYFISRDGTVTGVHYGFRKQDIHQVKNKLSAMIAER